MTWLTHTHTCLSKSLRFACYASENGFIAEASSQSDDREGNEHSAGSPGALHGAGSGARALLPPGRPASVPGVRGHGDPGEVLPAAWCARPGSAGTSRGPRVAPQDEAGVRAFQQRKRPPPPTPVVLPKSGLWAGAQHPWVRVRVGAGPRPLSSGCSLGWEPSRADPRLPALVQTGDLGP